jgi:hypothetical protein
VEEEPESELGAVRRYGMAGTAWPLPSAEGRDCVARGMQAVGLQCVARGMPADGRDCVARGMHAVGLRCVARGMPC